MPSCKRRKNKRGSKINEITLSTPDAKETDVPCAFCGLTVDNEFLYGKFIRKSGLNLHYFCMLFSSGLPQRGDPDSNGILGFFATDIRRELNRGKKLKCHYCRKTGSTVGCSAKKCCKTFHLPCGLQANSMHQFFESYPSYCEMHRPTQIILSSDRNQFHGAANSHCAICLGPVETRTSLHTLHSTCCRNSWFHRVCIQRMALSAGYFFKCPLCNNKKDFVMEMLTCGIYVPEQDAAWELEQNAFQELLHRHNRCDIKCCRCPDGREYSKENSRWQVVLCAMCGSHGCHVECGRLPHYKPYWECAVCRSVSPKKENPEDRSQKRRKDLPIARTLRGRRIPAVICIMSDEEDVLTVESSDSERVALPRSVAPLPQTDSDSDVSCYVNRRSFKRCRVIVSDDSDVEVSVSPVNISSTVTERANPCGSNVGYTAGSTDSNSESGFVESSDDTHLRLSYSEVALKTCNGARANSKTRNGKKTVVQNEHSERVTRSYKAKLRSYCE